eukprot:Rhum_TRINITY_DN18574_c0_g1::Rhum_TRINITY_DN18574_c0_g1_i1::g.167675::m.167675
MVAQTNGVKRGASDLLEVCADVLRDAGIRRRVLFRAAATADADVAGACVTHRVPAKPATAAGRGCSGADGAVACDGAEGALLHVPRGKKLHDFEMITNGTYGCTVRCSDAAHAGQRRGRVVVKAQRTHDPPALECVHRELRTLLHIRKLGGHPNIVALHDAWWTAGFVYMVLEELTCNLRNFIDDQPVCGCLTAIQRCAVIEGMYSGVHFLHQCGIMHRDLKPDNVCLTLTPPRADGRRVVQQVKLVDMGGSRDFDPALDYTYARYVTTFPYRAPESVPDTARYSEKVDVWSLGCIVAEMLLRRPLFACLESELPKCHAAFVCEAHGFPAATPPEVELLKASLVIDPARRHTALSALACYDATFAAPAVTPVLLASPPYNWEDVHESKRRIRASLDELLGAHNSSDTCREGACVKQAGPPVVDQAVVRAS